MDVALLASRLLLAAVFCVAGLAKLADRAGSRQAIIGFGMPEAVAGPLGFLLPITELMVGVALIPTSLARWGAVGAFVLLLLFIAGISINLLRGRSPECHCFGQVHSKPVSVTTLGRNGLLAALALFVAREGWGNPGLDAFGSISHLTVAQQVALVAAAALTGVLALQGWFMFHMLSQNGRLLVRIDRLEAAIVDADVRVATEGMLDKIPLPGLHIGSAAPTFALPTLRGEIMTLDALLAHGKRLLLIFSDPACGPCSELLPDAARWQRDYDDKLTVAVLSRGTIEENDLKSMEFGLDNVLLQEDWELGKVYLVPGTPSAVVIRPDGSIGSPTVGGPEAIRSLVSQELARPTSQSVPFLRHLPSTSRRNGSGGEQRLVTNGKPAPSLRLSSLKGDIVDLGDYKGAEVVVLFWNPACGFCQKLLPDLRRWEEEKPPEGPNLLVVSTGTHQDNRAMGLRSPVLIDGSLSAMQAFGANGTPVSVLVDAHGNVASPMAVGASAVLNLLNGRHRRIKIG